MDHAEAAAILRGDMAGIDVTQGGAAAAPSLDTMSAADRDAHRAMFLAHMKKAVGTRQ